jgi:hypothetical protein
MKHDSVGRDGAVRHLHRVLEVERAQDLVQDLAAPGVVHLCGTVRDDVPDAAAFEVLLGRFGNSCAGHGWGAAWRIFAKSCQNCSIDARCGASSVRDSDAHRRSGDLDVVSDLAMRPGLLHC